MWLWWNHRERAHVVWSALWSIQKHHIRSMLHVGTVGMFCRVPIDSEAKSWSHPDNGRFCVGLTSGKSDFGQDLRGISEGRAFCRPWS